MGTFTFRVRLPDGTIKVATITVMDLELICAKFASKGIEVIKILKRPFNNEEFDRKFVW
jgi:hypothetical protein